MLTDSNSIGEILYQTSLGLVNGDWVLLFVAVLVILAVLLVLAKARASTVLLSGICVVFLFSLMNGDLFFLLLIAVVMCGVLLANAIRKQFTGQ
jgi:hypothetical protein